MKHLRKRPRLKTCFSMWVSRGPFNIIRGMTFSSKKATVPTAAPSYSWQWRTTFVTNFSSKINEEVVRSQQEIMGYAAFSMMRMVSGYRLLYCYDSGHTDFRDPRHRIHRETLLFPHVL